MSDRPPAFRVSGSTPDPLAQLLVVPNGEDVIGVIQCENAGDATKLCAWLNERDEALDLLSEFRQDTHSEVDVRVWRAAEELLMRTGWWYIQPGVAAGVATPIDSTRPAGTQ